MKKRIIVIVVCIALLFTAIGVGVGAAIWSKEDYTVTADDIRFLRGYAGEKGEWSISDNKINLNGYGVVSSAQSIVWEPSTLDEESGVEFTITYNQAYTSLGGTKEDSNFYENHRFVIGLMDSQNFQGDAAGHGLGLELRLNSVEGKIRAMGFYYDSDETTDLVFPGRNYGGTSYTASANTTVKGKLCYNYSASKWTMYIDSTGDGAVDGASQMQFDPTSAWETTQQGKDYSKYFPNELFSRGKAYLVFGNYHAYNMNMSISIDKVYGDFSLQTENYTDTVETGSMNIALEDNILTRFYVKYSSYDMIAKGGNVNLTCGDKSVNYELIDGTLLEGLTYGYTIPVPAALGTETITLTVQSDALDGEENPVWSGTWSTTVKDYCDTLKANNAGEDEKSVALRDLCDSINDYCSKAKAYFDLVNDSN